MSRRPAVVPKRAMILAAGLGKRLRPLTDNLPKPMIAVAGRSLIDRAIDRLEEAGVEEVVVNLHHLGHLIEQHLKKRPSPKITFSHEAELLETGGGVVKALPLLGDEPFLVVNGDVLWLDGVTNALHRLAGGWDDATMDALLMVYTTVFAFGYRGVGDFTADPLGRLARRQEGFVAPWLFTGVQILHPRLFEGCKAEPFSLNRIYDKAIEADRLYGVVHDGEWFHVGTREGLGEAEAFLHARYPRTKPR